MVVISNNQDGNDDEEGTFALNIVAHPAATKATKRKSRTKYDRRRNKGLERKQHEEQTRKQQHEEAFEHQQKTGGNKQELKRQKWTDRNEDDLRENDKPKHSRNTEPVAAVPPVGHQSETLPHDYAGSTKNDENERALPSLSKQTLPQDTEERARYLAEFHPRPLELDRRSHAVRVAQDKQDSRHLFSTLEWSQFGLHSRIVQSLTACFQLTQPTLIQAKSIPAFSQLVQTPNNVLPLPNHNILLHSETGSGKTLAYLLPILQSLAIASNGHLRHGKNRVEYGTRCIILCPTRELAAQTFSTLERLCTSTFNWLVPGCLLGGDSGSRKSEKTRLRKGLALIVATPGRLLDHLSKTESLLLALKGRLEWFVLDEADRLLDMGLGDQVKQIVQRITANNAGSHDNSAWRSVLVSATVTPSVHQLATETLTVQGSKKDSSWVWVRGSSESNDDKPQSSSKHDKADAKDAPDSNELADSTPRQLAQWHMLVSAKWRLSALVALLVQRVHQKQRTVVFMDTKNSVDFHYALFQAMQESILDNRASEIKDDTSTFKTRDGIFGKQWKIYKLHGSVPYNERQVVLKNFLQNAKPKKVGDDTPIPKEGAILLATDVAARGLNLQDCDWTVQYDPPVEVSDYVHRAGRVARAGRAGHSLLFLLPSERDFLSVLKKRGVPKIAALSLSATLNAAAKLCPSLTKTGVERSGGGLGTTSDSSRLGEAFSSELQRRLEDCVLSKDEDEGALYELRDNPPKKRRREETSELLDMARNAFLSHIRAYPTREKCVRHVFAAKALHLGHVARSFALKETPKRLAAYKPKHTSLSGEPKRNSAMAFQAFVNKDADESHEGRGSHAEQQSEESPAQPASKKAKNFSDPKMVRMIMMENAKKLQGMDMM